MPDSGSGYLSVSGKAGEVLASLIERMGLSGLFSAAADDTAVKFTFDRFMDGYSGLKAMAKANGRKVAMRRKGGKVEISLPPIVDYANKVDIRPARLHAHERAPLRQPPRVRRNGQSLRTAR